MTIFSYSWKITSMSQVKNIHQPVPEETDSGDDMNDDDDDVVLL